MATQNSLTCQFIIAELIHCSDYHKSRGSSEMLTSLVALPRVRRCFRHGLFVSSFFVSSVSLSLSLFLSLFARFFAQCVPGCWVTTQSSTLFISFGVSLDGVTIAGNTYPVWTYQRIHVSCFKIRCFATFRGQVCPEEPVCL